MDGAGNDVALVEPPLEGREERTTATLRRAMASAERLIAHIDGADGQPRAG